MKRQGAGRVLTFAVTGALLGGVGVGGCGKYRGPFINPGPSELHPPQPEEELHVNPGPDEDPGAGEGDGGAADGGAADGGAADGGAPDDAPPDADVNPGPVDQPKPPVIVNTVKQPEPTPEPPEDIGTSTMNIRKVDEPPPKPKKAPKPPSNKYVNTVRVAEPESK